MRKILISLLLAATMLLPLTLVGCGDNQTDDASLEEESSARAATTLSLWLVSEKKVSSETETAIEEALNEITESKFTTKIDLVYLTEDEYFDALDKKINVCAEYKESHPDTASALPGLAAQTTAEAEETTAATIVNELGQRLLKYPEVEENQLDIVWISGKKLYTQYAADGMLSSLDTNLNSTSKVLKDYIYPSYLEQIKYNKNTYAIPNNHLIGDYTYLLINKALADKYYIDTDKISSFTDCADLIDEIGKHESGVAPVRAYADPVNIEYWMSDGDISILASYVPATATLGSRTILRSLFDTASYTGFKLLMQKCADNNWFAKDEDQPFGVAVINGGYELQKEYADDYYVKVLTYPTFTEDVAYASMFAVTSYTVNLNRSMEIITLLNTNAEVKNLLQYGIRDVNYAIDEDGVFSYLNDDYCMNNMNTGNEFLAYPAPDQSENVWENAKAANRDSRISPYYGLSEDFAAVDPAYAEKLAELTSTYVERMNACNSVAELTAFFEEAHTELSTNEMMKAALSTDSESNSPYAVYSRWFERLWPSAE